MQYETLFWSMAGVVVFALGGGALCGRFHSIKAVLVGVLVISVAVFAAIIGFTRQGELENLAVMLAIAAFMFCLVIATAAALLTRRIIRTT
jgi:hypothetical protein